MQVSHQRRRHNANSTWPEHRQQFNSGAPALNSLISSDVLAHETRIGYQQRGGKLLGNPDLAHHDAGGGSRPLHQKQTISSLQELLPLAGSAACCRIVKAGVQLLLSPPNPKAYGAVSGVKRTFVSCPLNVRF